MSDQTPGDTSGAPIEPSDTPTPASAASTAGLLGERYELGEVIGAGRMTKVHRGIDTVLNKPVAIKILDEDFVEDPVFADRFVQEALAFVEQSNSGDSTANAHLVELLDAGQDGDTFYVVMEYVQGSTLAQVLREEGKLPRDRALKTTEAVCRALEFAHGHGIIHRDVTTANILIGPGPDDVKLMDTGVARPTSATTAAQTSAMLGAATYISPEIARGGEPFARSDLYSLGIILYEMLTGRAPFSGESPVAVAMQHVRETPKKPSQLNPEITPELEAVIMKALAKNPADRYASADELRTDLEKVRVAQRQEEPGAPGDPTVVISPLSTADTMAFTSAGAAKERRVNPLLVVAVVAAVVLLLALVFIFVGRKPSVIVPNLVGQPYAVASNALSDAGLRTVIINSIVEDPAQAGLVIRQAPSPDTELVEGGTVTLTVGEVAAQIEVPSIAGLNQDAATASLTSVGLTLGTVTTQADSTVAPGLVISQLPAAGTLVGSGASVDVVVSSGVSIVEVPDISCAPINVVARQLAELDLQMSVQGQETNELCGTGNRIARQQPLPGSEVDAQSVVIVWTTEGAPVTSPTPSASVPPPGTLPAPATPSPAA